MCPRDKKTSKQSSSQHLSVAKYPQCSFRLLFIVSMQVSYSAKQWNSAIQQVSADSLQRGLGTRLILPFYALSQLQSNWLYSIVNYILSSFLFLSQFFITLFLFLCYTDETFPGQILEWLSFLTWPLTDTTTMINITFIKINHI